MPANARRRLLLDSFPTFSADIFHGLNQRLPRRRMKRTVCTFHDLFVLTGEYSTPEFRQRFAQQARDAAERADLIIAVSAFTAQQVQELLKVDASRLRVIHHGVAMPEKVAPDSERENIVLHVGAVQQRKNISVLVAAFEQLSSDWKLVLAGSAGYGAAEILERIKQSPAVDRIQLTGYLPQTELNALYEKARVFAFPSLDEGFGIPVLEAMAWGLPVVTSNRSALPEAAGDAALLADPYRLESVVGCLQRLTADAIQRTSLAAAGRKRAKSFSWPLAVEKTWTVYNELLV